MNKTLLKDALEWGFVVWFIGYVLGIVLFPVVPTNYIGWVISPIGIFITLLVLLKKVKGTTLGYFFIVAAAWMLIAVIFDYFFLVKLFKPADGYYKLDVYFYYATTFVLPVLVGWYKQRKSKSLSPEAI